MIEVVLGDITQVDVDAIVNAANRELAGGGGVDGAIHRAAGPELVVASAALAPCPPGHAVRTPGFALLSRFVIHAVGPIWEGGGRGEAKILAQAYESAFARALEAPACRSIAFPCISTGVYRFPREQAAQIALGVMRQHEQRFERIVACVFSPSDRALYEAALGAG